MDEEKIDKKVHEKKEGQIKQGLEVKKGKWNRRLRMWWKKRQ